MLNKGREPLPMFLSLGGKARESELGTDFETLNKDDGVDTILTQLDKFCLGDKLQPAYQAYDNFEKFKRLSEMPIADYVVEFKRTYNGKNI